MNNSLGFDVSSYELHDGVDWQLAKSRGVEWATMRVSWNVAGVDDCYVDNMEDSRGIIKRLSYHWFVPHVDAIRQADNFNAHYITSELGKMVDLEDTATVKGYHGIWPEIVKFCNRAGVDALYLSPAYIQAYLYDVPEINRFRLLIANWRVPVPGWVIPMEPGRWTAWQWTGNANGKYYGFKYAKEAAMYNWNGQV